MHADIPCFAGLLTYRLAGLLKQNFIYAKINRAQPHGSM